MMLTSPENDSSSISILQGFARGDTKLRRAVSAGLTIAAAYKIGQGWYASGRQRLVHTVTLSHDDDIYTAVHLWLLESLPSKKRRAIKVRTMSSRGEMSTSPDDSSGASPRSLQVFYDGSRQHTITIEGHRIKVDVHKDDSGFKSFEDLQRWKPERVVFTCQSEAGRDAVLDFLSSLAQKEYGTMKPRLYVVSRWGDGWNKVDLPARTLSSVVLRQGQSEAIVASLQRFLDEEEIYGRLGLPWHRGYLFHGPPGTGKTSLAKALAGHFGLDVYYVPLSDVKNDTNPVNLFSSIPQRSMLVLEDIDVVHAAKSRDDAEADGISLSGLLNALDGLATPHGLITVMTTNELETLDKALIRPGRADWVEELGYLDDEQLHRLASLALDSVPIFPKIKHEVSHAEVLEVLKRHFDDQAAGAQALISFLTNKTAEDQVIAISSANIIEIPDTKLELGWTPPRWRFIHRARWRKHQRKTSAAKSAAEQMKGKE